MQNEEVSLKSIIAPHFHEIHKDIKAENHTLYWLEGGRGSTKSTFTAEEIILGMMKDPLANAVGIRKVDRSIRDSIFSTLLVAIDMLKVSAFWKATIAPAMITYIPTGQAIYLKGLDDPQKLKSFRIRHGYPKYLWFEEATELSGPEEMRSVEQSILRGGKKFVQFVTFNPPKDPRSWVNKYQSEVIAKDANALINHSTYLTVPPEWLGPKFIADAERLKINNYEAYRHEYLGEAIGDIRRIVFWGRWEEKEFESPPISKIYQSRRFRGVDWGFASDPLAAISCFIMDDCLYIEQEEGGTGIEFEEIAQILDLFPESREWEWKADNSRPETISYISRQGFNIKGASKRSGTEDGSVKDGIAYLRAFKRIFIHPRCKETIKEFENYSYKVDKNTNEVLPILASGWDHRIDAIRYALVDYIGYEVSSLDIC